MEMQRIQKMILKKKVEGVPLPNVETTIKLWQLRWYHIGIRIELNIKSRNRPVRVSSRNLRPRHHCNYTFYNSIY